VISTVSAIGGKNPFLGWAYVAAAGVFVLLAVLGLARHLIKPRYELVWHTYFHCSRPFQQAFGRYVSPFLEPLIQPRTNDQFFMTVHGTIDITTIYLMLHVSRIFTGGVPDALATDDRPLRVGIGAERRARQLFGQPDRCPEDGSDANGHPHR
jgi:LEM3 (ligand-effect modulator 3) family / CDC50 family